MEKRLPGVSYPSHLSANDGNSTYMVGDLFSDEQSSKERDDDRDSDWRNAIYNEFGYTSNHFELKPLVQYDLGGLKQKQVDAKKSLDIAVDEDPADGSNVISISKFNSTGKYIKSIQPQHNVIVLNNRIQKLSSVKEKFTDKEIASNFHDNVSNLLNEVSDRGIRTFGDALSLLDTIRKTFKSKSSKRTQTLFSELVDIFHKAAIKEPSFENSLKDDVDYYRSLVLQQEQKIKSREENAKVSRLKYAEVSDNLYDLEKKSWKTENQIDSDKKEINKCELESRLLREDIMMLKSESKYGTLENDIDRCINEEARLQKETLQIVHDLQQIESDNKAMAKITDAYNKEAEEAAKSNVPRHEEEKLEENLKLLKMKIAIVKEEYEPDEKVYFDFSKALYDIEQKCLTLKHRLKHLTSEKTQYLSNHTPRPKWKTLRNKVDLIDYRKFLIGTIDSRIPIWSKQSKTSEKVELIVRQLHSYIQNARTKNSDVLHKEWKVLENIEKQLARWVGLLPKKQQVTEETLKKNATEGEKFLLSAGDRPDVPLCLRCPAKVKFPFKPVSLTHVRNEIRIILKAKATFDHVYGAISLPNFLHDYARLEYDDSKHGGPKVFVYNFINSVRKYRKYDGLCEMFYEVFRLRWEENYLHDIENMFGQLLTNFERAGRRVHGNDHDHDGTLPLDIARNVLRAFFPRKLDEDLDAIVETLQDENKKMHKLLMTQALESHCPECQAHANESIYHDPECIYYRHIFAHYYGLPVCSSHAVSVTKKLKEEEEEKALAEKQYVPFFKRGYFGLYAMPKSHEQHEDTHGTHHLNDAEKNSKDKNSKAKASNPQKNATGQTEDTAGAKKQGRKILSKPKSRRKYKQKKKSFLDLLTHQYKCEVDEFIAAVESEMLKFDWSDNLLLPKFQIIKALRLADPFLPDSVVYRYYQNGIKDLFYNKKKRMTAEDFVDIDFFVNNLRYSYCRPFDIYEGAVVDHLDHENVRAVLSFGSLNLGATDHLKIRHE